MIPEAIVVHHSAGNPQQTLASINAEHKARDFTLSSLNFYIGYHYVIDYFGEVTQTRLDNEIGCHCVPNIGLIGVCLLGNFQISEPSSAQIFSLQKLLYSLEFKYSIKIVVGHRDRNKTLCPGDNLYYAIFEPRANFISRFLAQFFKKPDHYV